MGQVFTWDAIWNGRIPKKASFRSVANMLRATLEDESSIVFAVMFGSVVRGDSNIRSGLDCAFVYKKDEQEKAMKTVQEIDQAAHALYVPVNFTPCDTVLAKTRMHHVGAVFREHLETSMESGGRIKGKLDGMFVPTMSNKHEIESYLKYKMHRMQTAFAKISTCNEERLTASLQKALECPSHVARKMLSYEHTLDGDSKKEVQERYQETMPPLLAEQLDRLLNMDSYYTRELESQVVEPDERRYAAVLCGLEEALPRAVEFLRSNILYLNGAR